MLRFISASWLNWNQLLSQGLDSRSNLNKPCLECLRLLSSHANRGHTRHRWHAHTKAGHTWHLLAGQWTYELSWRRFAGVLLLAPVHQNPTKTIWKYIDSLVWKVIPNVWLSFGGSTPATCLKGLTYSPAKQLKFHRAISCLYLEGHHHHQPDRAIDPMQQSTTATTAHILILTCTGKELELKDRKEPSLAIATLKSALQINVFFDGHSWTKLLLIQQKERISPKFWWLVLTTCLPSKLL